MNKKSKIINISAFIVDINDKRVKVTNIPNTWGLMYDRDSDMYEMINEVLFGDENGDSDDVLSTIFSMFYATTTIIPDVKLLEDLSKAVCNRQMRMLDDAKKQAEEINDEEVLKQISHEYEEVNKTVISLNTLFDKASKLN